VARLINPSPSLFGLPLRYSLDMLPLVAVAALHFYQQIVNAQESGANVNALTDVEYWRNLASRSESLIGLRC
jgi:hypothetical protein